MEILNYLIKTKFAFLYLSYLIYIKDEKFKKRIKNQTFHCIIITYNCSHFQQAFHVLRASSYLCYYMGSHKTSTFVRVA